MKGKRGGISELHICLLDRAVKEEMREHFLGERAGRTAGTESELQRCKRRVEKPVCSRQNIERPAQMAHATVLHSPA